MERYKQGLTSYKPTVLVTIYGSYFPSEEKKILHSLKTTLIHDEYTQTRLVDDLEELRRKDNLTPLEISQFCLERSDINLLVFTRNGKGKGIVKELGILADIRRCRKHPFCVIFDEVKGDDENKENTSIPPLSRDDVDDARLTKRTFHSVQELNHIITTETYQILRKLAKKNMIRIS